MGQRAGFWLAMPMVTSMLIAVTAFGWPASALATDYGSQVVVPFTGLSEPRSVAVDTGGNIYATTQVTGEAPRGRVVELPAGATSLAQQRTLPFSEIYYQGGLAVDSAGNVYTSNNGPILNEKASGAVFELPAGATTSAEQLTRAQCLDFPTSLAVGAAGTLYIIALETYELAPGAGSCEWSELPMKGEDLAGAAVDPRGDFYVAMNNYPDAELLEIPAGATKEDEVITVPGGNITQADSAQAVARDAAGNLYVAIDWLGSRSGMQYEEEGQVLELPAGATNTSELITLPLSGLGTRLGLAVDTHDNVYVADTAHNRIVELPVATEEPTKPGGGSGEKEETPTKETTEPEHTPSGTNSGDGSSSGGTNTGGGNTNQPTGNISGSSLTPAPTVAAIQSALAGALAHAGPPTIASLLKGRAYSFGFTAPGAGTLTIQWTLASAGHKTVVIATGSKSFSAAERSTVSVHLTSAGRKLLKRGRAVRIISQVTFKPSSGSTQTKRAPLTIRLGKATGGRR